VTYFYTRLADFLIGLVRLVARKFKKSDKPATLKRDVCNVIQWRKLHQICIVMFSVLSRAWCYFSVHCNIKVSV